VLEIFCHEAGVAGARAVVARRRGRWFSPALSSLAELLLDDTAFWQRLATVPALDVLHDVAPPPALLAADDARLDRIVEAFAGVIDAKSPYTHDHSRRVAEYAVAAGARLGFAPARLVRLRRAALLHDIGKLGVTNAVLDKPGKLTPEEWAEMREHTRHTLEILDAVPVFRELAADAAAHHERLNGTGYHRGVASPGLGPAARVLAVADVTDALRSDRPYRAGLAVERVVAMLRTDVAAGALCPRSVSAMIDVLQTDGAAAA
jgi:putative nucleotidyltransferase with HDIG domain